MMSQNDFPPHHHHPNLNSSLEFFFSLTEVVGQLPAADLLGFLPELQRVLGDVIARHVRCHDEDGVFTFDGLPLSVCEAPLTARRALHSETFHRTETADERDVTAAHEYSPHQRAAA